jgi:hypothetical protein
MSTNGNTTTPATPDAAPEKMLLQVIHEEWKAAGSKAPTAKEAQALVTAWKAASKARDVAEAAFTKAQEAESAACAAIVRARGKGRIKIGDATYIPMSRGKTVYFRREGGEEVEAFG